MLRGYLWLGIGQVPVLLEPPPSADSPHDAPPLLVDCTGGQQVAGTPLREDRSLPFGWNHGHHHEPK